MKSLLSQVRQFLSNTYQKPVSPQEILRIAVGVGLFVSLFLIVFQPFGFSKVQSPFKFWYIGGFGLVSFLVVSSTGLLLYPFLFGKRSLMLWESILWDSFTLLMVAIGNYGYMLFLFGFRQGSMSFFAVMLFFTFLVGLFPITFLALYQYIDYLKNDQKLSPGEDTPVYPSTILCLKSGQTKDYFEIQSEKLSYLEASDNYVTLYYWEEGQLQQKLMRITLQKALDQLPSHGFFQCHRSFVINLLGVASLEGNAQKMQVRLKGQDTRIPVSRRRIAELKNALGPMANP